MCSISSIIGMEQNSGEIEQYDKIFYFKKRNYIKTKLHFAHFKKFDDATGFSSRIVGKEIGEVGLHVIASLAVREYHIKIGKKSTPFRRQKTVKRLIQCLTDIEPKEQFSWSFNAFSQPLIPSNF